MQGLPDGQPSGPVQIPQVVYVSFSAEIVPQTSEALLGVCGKLAIQRVPEVVLLLSTFGGSVMHGLTLYNVLRGMPFSLTTHNVGAVNSIGNVVFLAGDKRYACPSATFMFHGVGFDIHQPTRLEEKNLRERLDGLQADQKKIGSVIADRTSLTQEEIERLFLEASTKDTDYAKSKGLIDEVRDVSIPAGAPVHQLVFQR